MSIYAITYKLVIVGLYTAESVKSLHDQLMQVYTDGIPDGVDIVHIGDIDGRIIADTGCIIRPLNYYDEANHMSVDELRDAANAPEEVHEDDV